MTLQSAATMILKYLDGNRRARNSYPDADLPIEEAMRMLAENVLEPACEYCGYRGEPSATDRDAVCCAGCGEWSGGEVEPKPIQATLFTDSATD